MTNPTKLTKPATGFIPNGKISKGYFIQSKVWICTDWMHFCGLKPLCKARLRPQEKSLADQLPLEQNLLKTALGPDNFCVNERLNKDGIFPALCIKINACTTLG